MTFNLETLIELGTLAVGILGLCFMFVQWTNGQLHNRIDKLEDAINEKVEALRTEAKTDTALAFDMIKDMVKEIREDVRWLMQNLKKDK